MVLLWPSVQQPLPLLLSRIPPSMITDSDIGCPIISLSMALLWLAIWRLWPISTVTLNSILFLLKSMRLVGEQYLPRPLPLITEQKSILSVMSSISVANPLPQPPPNPMPSMYTISVLGTVFPHPGSLTEIWPSRPCSPGVMWITRSWLSLVRAELYRRTEWSYPMVRPYPLRETYWPSV